MNMQPSAVVSLNVNRPDAARIDGLLAELASSSTQWRALVLRVAKQIRQRLTTLGVASAPAVAKQPAAATSSSSSSSAAPAVAKQTVVKGGGATSSSVDANQSTTMTMPPDHGCVEIAVILNYFSCQF
jgi:hypothetical protein